MPDAAPRRILIADDHALIRDALTTTVRHMHPTAKCEEVATSAAVIAAVEGAGWDLVILDLGLPGAGEMETLRRMRALRPEMPILVFSMFTEEKMGRAAVETGANGYLCKTADRALIRTAVVETLAGRGYLSERLRQILALRPSEKKGMETSLSPRELEVLLALGRGLSNKEIAARLEVQASSVGTYRTRIMEKLSLRTNADLQRYIVENRLVHE